MIKGPKTSVTACNRSYPANWRQMNRKFFNIQTDVSTLKTLVLSEGFFAPSPSCELVVSPTLTETIDDTWRWWQCSRSLRQRFACVFFFCGSHSCSLFSYLYFVRINTQSSYARCETFSGFSIAPGSHLRLTMVTFISLVHKYCGIRIENTWIVLHGVGFFIKSYLMHHHCRKTNMWENAAVLK